MNGNEHGWEYLYAEFALGKNGYILLGINDSPSTYAYSLADLGDRLGLQHWELVNTFPGRRAVRKDWLSLQDVVSGNTSNILDVLILAFKRPLTAQRIQEKQEQKVKRKGEAAQFLHYLRDGGIQLELQGGGELRIRRGRLSVESQEKFDFFKPELIEILANELRK